MSPQAIASLPTEKPEVVTAPSQNVVTPSKTVVTPRVTPSQDVVTPSQTTNEVQSTEVTKVVEELTPITILAFIKAPLSKGISMTELRQKLGHEKGKLWTVKLNEYVDAILSLRKHHKKAGDIYASMLEVYSNQLGSLVAALLRVPLQSDGSPIEGWEKLILCSNPKGTSKGTTKETAKDTRNRLGHTVVGSTNGLPPIVDDYADFWAEDGPWTCSIANLLAETTKVATPPSTTQPQR